ncbi:MAG: MFS transporter, partial [Symbiobacteriaceae bacterium]
MLSPALAASIIALPALARAGALPPALGSVLGRLENGVPLAFGLDAASFLLAATVLALLHIPSPRDVRQAGSSEPVASLWADVRFGVEYIRRRPPLAWLLATFAVVNLCLPLGVFVPLIVKVELAADWMARGMTYEAALNTTMALGGLAGGILVSLWGGARRRRVVELLLSILLGGIAQMGLGLAPGLYLAGAAAFFVSFVGPLANAHSQAIWQGQVERGYQGRVFAVRRVIAWSLTPLGQVIAGWLAARVVGTLPDAPPEVETPKALPPGRRRRKGQLPVQGRQFRGEDIRRARLKVRWTQDQLATHLGVSQRYISMLENGQRQPSKDLLRRLEQWLAWA